MEVFDININLNITLQLVPAKGSCQTDERKMKRSYKCSPVFYWSTESQNEDMAVKN